jgi:hypothetical protein
MVSTYGLKGEYIQTKNPSTLETYKNLQISKDADNKSVIFPLFKQCLLLLTMSEVTIMCPLEKIFGKTAQMTVLKNSFENQNEPTYPSGIAKETGLSHAKYKGLSHHWSCQGSL